MTGIYFSGTGNSKHCLNVFLGNDKSFSIENDDCIEHIENDNIIIFAYPTHFSNIPPIVKDFVKNNSKLWNGKHIFIIVTQGLMSGDGSGILARLLKKYGAVIDGGVHVTMPDAVLDVKAVKKTFPEYNDEIKKADIKLISARKKYDDGKPTKQGLHIISHLIGLFGQRLYYLKTSKNYSNKLKIDNSKCIHCNKCSDNCPMKNLTVKDNKVIAGIRCTMCYRCINNCPAKAITLIGKEVIQQFKFFE